MIDYLSGVVSIANRQELLLRQTQIDASIPCGLVIVQGHLWIFVLEELVYYLKLSLLSHLVWVVSSTSQIMLYVVVESVNSAAGLVNTGCNKLTFRRWPMLVDPSDQGCSQTSLKTQCLFHSTNYSTFYCTLYWFFIEKKLHFGFAVFYSRIINKHEQLYSETRNKLGPISTVESFYLSKAPHHFTINWTSVTVYKGYIYNPSADKSAL